MTLSDEASQRTVIINSHGHQSAGLLLQYPGLDDNGETYSVVGVVSEIPGRQEGDLILVTLATGFCVPATITHIYPTKRNFRAEVMADVVERAGITVTGMPGYSAAGDDQKIVFFAVGD